MRFLFVFLAVTFALLYTTTAWPWPKYTSGTTDVVQNMRGLLERRQDRSDQGSSGNSGDAESDGSNDNGNSNNNDSNNDNQDDGKDQQGDSAENDNGDDNADSNADEGGGGDKNKNDEVDKEDGPSETGSGSSAEETDGSNNDNKDNKDKNNKDEKDNGDDKSDEDGDKATKTFDPRLPPGGIQMVTPAITTTEYYKIGDYVTFAWNYTSLSVTPSAVDVLAECSTNQATYTLAQNLTVKPTNKLVWDTGEFQATATIELLTSTYTLVIYDAGNEDGVSAVPRSGYLGVFNQWRFGMYKPQKKKKGPSQLECTTCNAALSAHERQTLGFLFGMAALTVLSFGWFANGFMGGVF